MIKVNLKKSYLGQFFVLFFLTFLISFTIQTGISSEFFKNPIDDFLLFAYKFNFGITFLFTTTALLLNKILKDQMGFIFIAGSAMKIMIFMAISYFKELEVARSVALDFLVPYFVCLLLEIMTIAKILKQT